MFVPAEQVSCSPALAVYHGGMSAPSSNDLAQLRAEAAAATTAAAVRRLFRRSDQIRKRAAIESLSPDLLSDDELR